MNRSHQAAVGFAAAGLLATTTLASASTGTDAPTSMADVPLIDRELLFGNPERTGVQLSPDAKYVSFLAPIDGVLNVWVAPIGDISAAEPITADDDRGIRSYFWAHNGTHLIYLQDRDGDENFRAYSVEIETRNETILTPMDGVQTRIAATDEDYPNEILVQVNDRDPQLHDIHRVDVTTGDSKMVYKNTGYVGFVIDNDMQVRAGARMGPDGSMTYDRIMGEATSELVHFPAIDGLTSGIGGFIGDSNDVYMQDSRAGDTSGLYRMNIETGEQALIHRDERADVAGAIVNPVTDEIEAVIVNHLKPERHFVDKAIEAEFARLEALRDGEVSVTDRSQDDRTWLLAYTRDDGPVEYVHYDRDSGRTKYLFSNRPELEDLALSKMHPVVVEARDGLDLVSYLTLPVWTDSDGDARPTEALPMVLMVHGGPWARDSWGFNPYHQWLANRGYAVMSVNFRGSTGFGKSFIAEGNGQWADAMHTDLLDAVAWAVEQGVADEDRVAIMGGSYGGYATLAGLTFSPEVFACGVDIVGPSNLITLLESIPPYWEQIIGMFTSRVADHRTPEGRRKLRDMSPLTHVDEIVRPLLIGQGANDPRVKIAESDQIVEAMNERDIPVTYVVFPDEGHGFARPENNSAFNAVVETFLAEHIGGRFEPIGTSVVDSSAQIRDFGGVEIEGAELYVPNPEAEAAAKAELEKAVAYEDLTDAQRAIADQGLQQIAAVPAEMLAMAEQQLVAQLAAVPDEMRPALQHLLGVVREKIAANEAGGDSDG